MDENYILPQTYLVCEYWFGIHITKIEKTSESTKDFHE